MFRLNNNSLAVRRVLPTVPQSIARTAVLVAFAAAATASFGQYNVTVLGDGVALGATSTTIYGYSGGGSTHAEAATWDRTSGTYTSHNPTGYTSSVMNGGSGDLIGGFVAGTASNPFIQDAYIWNTANGTSVDVNPNGARVSLINGMGGHWASGYAEIGGTEVAEVWDLSNNNQASSLDMAGLDSGSSFGTNGVGFVGAGSHSGSQYAAYWESTGSAAILLQASGAQSSTAASIANNTIAGYGISSSNYQFAYDWNATTLIGQALDSTGFNRSGATGTNGAQVVGYGFLAGSGAEHAVVWNVAANNYTDLNGSFDQSQAEAIDAQGDVFGYGVSNGVYKAVEWTPQAAPEPSGLLILGGLATLGVVFARRK